ncbi:MAG: excinuclease ABC subunit UvrA [Chitinophagia bacterium]|jgi:excinuclease ABC subunit A|nr:excinuclease ABC subunit UvrA [Chitinophagia bacterium]NCA30132.1 excinuclease ABC subunit UvrA [Chitinophagia bacterium]NDD15620.1 excinuclease ABC subunit UvrA [Chitinophagia bacterium]
MSQIKEYITIVGAREHNLKNFDITIPKNQLVVFTGVSGSGKSSLAFDTLYNEGQRRYMESFSAYARQFMGEMERPDVDQITGLSPVIAIEQKTTNKNPRSTVGTVTELYDFLRLLYARIGKAYSYNTGKPMVKFSEAEIIQNIFTQFKDKKINLLAPVVRGRKGHYRELFEEIRKKGFVKARVDGEIIELRPKYQVDRYKIHDIEIVIDRIPVTDAMKIRLGESVAQCLKMGKDLLFVLEEGKTKLVQYSKQLMCETTGLSYEEPSPNSFSFNSPYGACPNCKGLGNVYAIDMSLLLQDHSLSINEGAIHPLGEAREASVFNQIKLFARKHKINLDKALKDLSKEHLNLILFGDKNISSTLDMDLNDENIPNEYTGSYEGIVPMMKRWFTSSQSTDHLKAWVESYMELNTCPTCEGARLRKESLWFKVNDKNIAALNDMHLDALQDWFKKIPAKLDKKDTQIASAILKEIDDRISFLMNVGLSYLSLSRPSKSLSGGESQRIRLATQIGSQLQGITYILDEPSIGLHQRDNQRLITALKQLRDIGNTVLVVEHDKDIMMAADYLVDIGPKAGIHGGHIVAQGTPKEIIKLKSDTSLFLAGKKKIEIPTERRKGNGLYIQIKGATGNTLQKVNCSFPLGTFTVVTGVSGSGKSTLINETLYPILSQFCYNSKTKPMPFVKVEGIEQIDKVIEIDQSPIGRTPRSNPATYCGFFTDIRTLFASVPEAKIRGYQAGRFSFNVKSGRCEVCEGGGMRVIEMNFLPDVYVHCEKCGGKRYNRETLEIRYKGKSISDVLNMTVEEACDFFQAVPFIYRKLKVLLEVGLGYITLGQSAVTLSGGEAQRVKLATELGKKDTGKTFYILDEPTTGLHFQDIQLLIGVLNRLVDRGNTVLVIEHNMDVIKVADHIIDLGPEGGSGGGLIQFTGTPEEMIKKSKTHTAKFLALEMK